MFKITCVITKLTNYRNISTTFLATAGNVRVRFAPSPTGHLHLGGLRTALINYLFAKSRHGKFILRIEDTDQTRLVPGAKEQLIKDLEWAGIIPDEGPKYGGSLGPYIQSQRKKIYNDEVQELLQNNSAYHCFCTPKRLNLLKREALRNQQVPKYDNACRKLSKDEVKRKLDKKEPYCIRFKLTPDASPFEDIIYGNIALDIAQQEGDPVIIKTDGMPTYHFANVVDDHLMGITHVLRGVEWQISTPKHILLYKAFGWEPPKFGHLPLLLNSDGSKLSKRQGDITVDAYRKSGIFPQALVNFITLSGGGFDKLQSLKPKSYSLDELRDHFNLRRVNSNSCRLPEDRLPEFNRLEIQRLLNNQVDRVNLISQLRNLVIEKYGESELLHLDEEHLSSVLIWSQDRVSKLQELLSENLEFLWKLPPKPKKPPSGDLKDFLIELKNSLITTYTFEKEQIKTTLHMVSMNNKEDFKNLMAELRKVLSGSKVGPPVSEMITILGKESTLKRISNALHQNNEGLQNCYSEFRSKKL
ncbi:probable glutamate--tRNA ligase, mitochondrial [Ctenocephalides felis]|uniref:probable glutamate--tRNA ligase, mitochondrial n=2 Tax=Ctenocephalides felis TaxID=7515 RepID=UPI000E6E50D9|nr:probable glutamate--tRNA ligase, mitochondrial [Ctenocephalides felis]